MRGAGLPESPARAPRPEAVPRVHESTWGLMNATAKSEDASDPAGVRNAGESPESFKLKNSSPFGMRQIETSAADWLASTWRLTRRGIGQ